MQPLSNDLRQRILEAVDNREGSRRKLAARFKVNTSTITKLLRLRRETGSFEPRPHAGGVTPTLDDDALQRLRELVETTPDATLESLRQQMSITGSRMIICRALQKLGLPLKKKSRHACERDTPEVQEERREFAEEVESIEPRRLVFVDETGVTTAMTPAYGRAPGRGAGRGVGPGVVGVGDGDRGDGPGWGPRPAGVPGGGQRPDLPGLCRAGPGAGLAPRGRRGLRQPDVAPVAGSVRGDRACRSERLAAAAVQPGLHADRGDVLEVQGVPPPGRCAGQGAPLRGHRRRTTRGDPPGHPRLVPARRTVCHASVIRCRAMPASPRTIIPRPIR